MNKKSLSNSAQSEYLVAAADATSQRHVLGVVDDCKHYSSSTWTGEARTYTSLLGVHEQQQQQARQPDYDNATHTIDPSNYDNNAGMSVSASEVSS